jgi:hypothetical protein
VRTSLSVAVKVIRKFLHLDYESLRAELFQGADQAHIYGALGRAQFLGNLG